jgi:DeoR/GlpR family transcriptional regulator of sugar metabolism
MTDEADIAGAQASASGGASLPAVRHNRLIELLRVHGQMTVNEMVEQLSVSRDTVRRDLDQLESRGLLQRTHGGAIYNDTLVRVDTTLGTRMDAFAAAKQRMGKAAAALIRDGETLIVNGGSSTCFFAAALSGKQNLTVITNNLRLPPATPESCLRSIHILGGTYWPVSQVTIGPVGFPDVSGISADTAVIGATGISAGGVSMGRLEEASETTAMIKVAARTIALIDHSKFNVTAFARIATLTQITFLVTDAWPPDAIMLALKKAGTQVIVA